MDKRAKKEEKILKDFQKISKILTELIPRRKDGGRDYLPPSFDEL